MRLLATILLLVAMSGFAVPQKQKRREAKEDVPVQMQAAQRALQTARTELMNAGEEWGGHRAEAIKHVDAALSEIQQAVAFAKQHHEIK